MGRDTHAHQFKRANREFRFLRTRLGRLIRDIVRKTRSHAWQREAFDDPLRKAMQIRSQCQHQRGRKIVVGEQCDVRFGGS